MKNLCNGCDLCCRHVAIEIDPPEDKEGWNNIIWYVMHENIFVGIDEDNDWLIEFKTKCKALNKHNCKIYKDRPNICRSYSIENCEISGEGSPYKVLFTKREDVLEYCKKNNIKI